MISEDVLRVQSGTSRGTGVSPVQKMKGSLKDGPAHAPQPGKKGSALRHTESVAEVGDTHVSC